jgi:hypothetical protein
MQLRDLGVAVVIYPRLLTACALQGMKNGLELLQQSLDVPGVSTPIAASLSAHV